MPTLENPKPYTSPDQRHITFTMTGEDAIAKAAQICIASSASFSIEPLCDDQWEIKCKNEQQSFFSELLALSQNGITHDAMSLREQAADLLAKAAAIDNLKPFVVIHEQRNQAPEARIAWATSNPGVLA